ncbi:flagellar biosynthetic protein FliO [Motiliproteus sp. MSK22-1]|uniref:flagellar biosynthetic protein FliO n=1 Tax=Motiliproteus sp. MSK22-1 TaxID=1897630 RepID=UPI0009786E4C|nr:flagellar biosynthetic protein FliO [Motiliproteus sp. MSK22-1]OMH30042.1 flagellar biosynthetic protein FliO [Motiliproteus sp. MSK22-1]
MANSAIKWLFLVLLLLTSVNAMAQAVITSAAVKSSSTESVTSVSAGANPGGNVVDSTAPVVVPPFSTDSILQMLFGLGLVVALIFTLAWLLKRIGGVGGFAQSGLRVVATLPLSTRERAVLVQAGDKQLLLGVAPGRVNLLETFDKPVIDSASTSGNQFSHRLKDAIARRQSKPQAVTDPLSATGGRSRHVDLDAEEPHAELESRNKG